MSLPPRLDPANWAAAAWALWAWRRARRQLRARGLRFAPPPAPPRLPVRARRAVVAVLCRTGATCLERAAVLQTWDLAHDQGRELVVGVTRPSAGFRAHAWLDGDEPCHAEGFSELLRLPPR